jgi:predicted 3-demethylubiquinone-9 3-methyltransferase (glyoxalase superfamily)
MSTIVPFLMFEGKAEEAMNFYTSSMFVTCDTEQEMDELFQKLSQDGQVLMPLAPTPVSKKFGWVTDRYGVSWQLNLPIT